MKRKYLRIIIIIKTQGDEVIAVMTSENPGYSLRNMYAQCGYSLFYCGVSNGGKTSVRYDKNPIMTYMSVTGDMTACYLAVILESHTDDLAPYQSKES